MKDMRFDEFMKETEEHVATYARHNNEIAYEHACLMVALRFTRAGLTLSEGQIRKIVNRAWDKTLAPVCEVAK